MTRTKCLNPFFFTLLGLFLLQNIYAQKLNSPFPTKGKTTFIKGNMSLISTYKNNRIENDTTLRWDKAFGIHLRPSLTYERMTAKGSFFQASLTNVHFETQDNYFEKDINPLALNIPILGHKTRDIAFGTLWEWGHAIEYKADKKHIFFIGYGFEQLFTSYKMLPYTTIEFPLEQIRMGLTYRLTPTWRYAWKENIVIDVNLPFAFFSTTYQYTNYKNPILPTYQQRRSEFLTTFTPQNVQLRIGIGVKI